MTGKLQRVAVVTGGSTGIGLACVEALLNAGWNVGFFGQNETRVRSAEAKLAESCGTAQKLIADVVDIRDYDAVGEFFARVSAELGPVTGLVCNAGFSPKGPAGRVSLADIDLQEWKDVIAINQTGTMLCCQFALKSMTEAGHGRVVLIGSLAGRTLPKIAGASYVASKSAIVGIARSIVSEYSSFGVTANTICPGRIITEMTGDASQPANIAALERIPAGRLGAPADIACVVEFLFRDKSDFINGAIIDVNGGEFVPA